MTRTVIVTGANRGIAPKLAELGHQVLLGSRDLKAGEDAVQSLRRPDLNLEPVQIDLTSAATVDAAIRVIQKSGRQLDMLVNNAGVLHEKPLLELTDEESPTRSRCTSRVRFASSARWRRA